MGETTIDEDWYAKEHGEILALACKGDNGGHDESATYGKDAAFHRAQSQARFHDALGSFLQGHGGAT